MTQAIVTYLNAVIDTVGRVDERYCMAELRSDGTTTVPYTYVGNGKVKPISIDVGSLSYWRISGAVPPMEQIASQYGKPRLSATYPLRLVIIARRADSTVDDGFMPTRLAEDIANALTGSHPDLKTLLKANTVSVSAGYDVNITSVWADEFKGTGVNDPNYTRTIMALSVSVTVVGDRACWENECDYDPDILHLFDFCQAGTVARLTDEQVTCLEAALCEPCADATVTVNTAPFGTALSGGGLNVPVVNGGDNPVGSKQGSDWVIDNNATFINATQVTDQEAEVDANIFVTLDGAQSGTWNAGLQTWEVTTPPPSQVWVRDPNWMAIPSVSASDEVFYGLFLVFENDHNQLSVAIGVGPTINFGDGSAPVTGSGALTTHIYDYASMAGPIHSYQPDPSIPAKNYKQAMVSVTGTITVLQFGVAPSLNPYGTNNFVDINMSMPNRSGFGLRLSRAVTTARNMAICERVRIWNWNGAYAAEGTFDNMPSLRVIQFPSQGDFTRMLAYCANLDLGDMNTQATTLNSAFRSIDVSNSSICSAGHVVANNIASTGLVNAFRLNGNLQYVLSLSSTAANVNIDGCFADSNKLRYLGYIDIPNLVAMNIAFSGCSMLEEIVFISCANVTTATSAFANCSKLRNLVMPGLTRGVSIAGTAMGNYGMNNFANSIGTASGAQTITVTGTPFGALLTALDATALAIRLVMTGKGYAVAN